MRFLKGIGWRGSLYAQQPKQGFDDEPAFIANSSNKINRKRRWIQLVFLFGLIVSLPVFSQVNKGEYFFDTDPGQGNGFNIPVTSVADSIVINQTIPVSSLSVGFHTLYVRTRMSKHWSQTESRAFFITSSTSASGGPVSQLEYFFDTEPGIGSGTKINLTASGDSVERTTAIPLGSLSSGFHTLYIRAKNNRGYSMTESRPFFILSSTSSTAGPISQLEYFFDTDPGVGSGTKITVSPASDSSEKITVIPVSSLTAGFHTLYIRAKNNRGYSMTESRAFFITSSSSSTAGPISQLEYFFDSDPGVGLGTKIAISPSADSVEKTSIIPISSLSAGFHTLYIRAKNNRGYSMTESRSFFIVSASANNSGPINQLEYFFDTDPGIGKGVKISVNPAADSSEKTAVIPVNSLASGFHTLYIRAKNNTGYGQTESRTFFIFPASSLNSGPVAKMEYFIDTDPGLGQGTPISAFTTSDSVEVTRVITLPSNIAIGAHKLYVRSQTSDKRWGITEVKDFTIACGATEISATQPQVCPGLATVLSFTAGNIPGTYQWIRNGVAISGATSFNLTVNQPGNYALLYTNGNCSDTSDVQAIGTGTTTIAAFTPNTPQQICAGQSATFQGNSTSGLTYQWLRNGSLFSSGSSQINTSTLGNYSLVITNATGCKDTSDAVALTATTGPGDPSVFGTNQWRVYTYFGTDLSLSNPANYLGFYTVASLSYNSSIDWSNGGSPGSAPGYTGCTMGSDNFTMAMKRRGFPAGAYTLNIPIHDDGIVVLLDGNQVYSAGCCSTNPTLTLGTLGANSTLEIRLNEGGGGAGLSFTLDVSVLQAGTISADQTICSSGTPALLNNTAGASGGSTATITYLWQDSLDGGSWQNIANSNAATFQPGTLSATRWFRRKATNGPDVVFSNVVKITVVTPVGNPATFPTNEWNVYAYSGADLNVGTGLTYTGFYPVQGLNVNTADQWVVNSSPSSATTYQGCPLSSDNFTIVLKRKGFPSGDYSFTINYHDDQIRVLVDGIQVFENVGCCTGHPAFSVGTLGANSTVEVRLVEGGGQAQVSFTMESSSFQGGEIAANQSQCAGIAPNLLTSIGAASGGGATTITYQWQDSTVNGSWQNISAATNLTFQPGVLNATRFYRRKATGNGNLVSFSNQISIIVSPKPTATLSQTGPFTLCQGDSRNLSVSVTNGASIQWLRNGASIGQTSTTISVSLAGTYKAVATIGTCTDTTNGVVINVNPKPAPVITPAGPLSICSSGSTLLTLTNPGNGLTHQWKNNGVSVAGINSITVSTDGIFYVVSTNSSTGCKDSSNAVSVNLVNPVVTPSGPVAICQGSSTNLTVSNTGTAGIQWLRNESPVAGATNPILSVSQAGTYKAVATIAGICTDTSNAVTISINALPIANITSVSDSFCVGGSTILFANTGSGLTYQWKRNGTNLPTAQADSLVVNQAGTYSVEVKNASNCSQISNSIVVRSVNNLTWFLDQDGDGYSAGVTVSSCTRPQSGFLPAELEATSGDCNDQDPTINPSRQFFSFVGTNGFESALCSPLQGTPYTTFRFEVVYTDLNNNPPPVTFPRVILDFEGNGNLNGPNDRTILMQEFDAKDVDYANGKRYFASVNSLPSGLNYTTRVVSNIGTCGTILGPTNAPDVFILSDLQIFANDITFDNINPAVSSNLQISARINNVSDFPAQNFVVHLVNQYDTTIVYPDIVVPFLSAQSSTIVTWDIVTPSVPAWCPMQVSVDWTNLIQETNELDNSAIRPFINGNFNVPGSITFNPSVVPNTIVAVAGASGTLTGAAIYTGTAVPLQNPGVAGAQVNFTIQPGGQTYTTYTNAGGFINYSFLVGLTPGTYTVTGTITDFTLTSSFTVTFIVIPPVCLPDLVADLTVSSNNIVEGESISGSLRITNNGCQNVTDSTMVEFSQSGGSPILPDVKIPPLAIGESFIIPFSNLLFTTPGTFSVCGLADGGFAINEVAEFNNQSCEIITVIPFLPDIFPVNCGVSGQQFISGLPSTISISLANSGGSATGSFTTRVILSREGVPVDTIDQLIPNLPRQSNTTFSFQYTYPSPGTYGLNVYCDSPAPTGIVTETDETNNQSNCGILILATRADLAFTGDCDDLKVEPADPAFPGTHTIKAKVGNIGNATAVAPILVRFSLSGGQVIEETISSSIAPGQSVLITKSFTGVAPATQTISAVIDPNNSVAEFSKLNNQMGPKSLCHEFAPVQSFCGGAWWLSTYLKNQAIFLNVPVLVSGAYKASQLKTRFFVSGPGLTGTLNLGDAVLNNVTETCNCPVVTTLPVSFAFPEEGEYTFTFVTDPDGQYLECDETNNTLVRKVQVSGLPDMRVLSQLINPSKLNPDVNEPILIQANYENIGLSNINQTMKFKMLIDEIPHDSATVNGLVTGDNFTVNFTKVWSSDLVGSHVIRTVIDADNVIQESVESNNEATRAVIVGAAANMYFQVFSPSNSSPNLNQNIQVVARIGNNGDEDVEGLVQLFYINNQGDTIQIGQAPVSVAGNDSTLLSFPWTVVDNATTLIGKIVNANIMEFNYDDNLATSALGLFDVNLISTPSCAGKPNGTLTAQISGGTSPYAIQWSTGLIGDTLKAGPGNYTALVKDASGIEVLVQGSISNLPGVRFFIDADGDGHGNPAQDSVDCALPPGFSVDSSDCNDSDPTVYKKQSRPSISHSGGLTFCSGGSVILSTTEVAGLSYLWSNNATGTSTTVSTTGNYTVTASGDSSCPVTSLPIAVEALTSIVPTASISASPAGPICTGTQVTFSAVTTGGGIQPSYEWYLNDVFVFDGLDYVTDTLKNNDKVQFVFTSSESCASPVVVLSSKLTMSVSNSLAANAGPDQKVCGNSATLTGNGTGTWTLLSGTGLISNPTSATTLVTGLGSGVNQFIWTRSGGTCPVTFDTVSITVTPEPTAADAGFDRLLCGSASSLTGNIPTSGTGTWTVVAPSTATIQDSLDPSSPVSNLDIGTNTFVWSIKNGTCPASTDTVNFIREALPSVSNAGSDQTICSNQTSLQGNTPAVGSGVWTKISGTGLLTDSLSPTSLVSNLQAGVNQFVWTISNGLCTENRDTVSITVQPAPTQANAGANQVICDPNATLAGNSPTSGTGTWRLLSGTGTLQDSSIAATSINNLGVGENILIWSIVSGLCPASEDTVSIVRQAKPGVSIAGADQEICANQTTLEGNVPAIGTGVWTLLSGTGTISNPLQADASVTGLAAGTNSFIWTITNGICPSSVDTVEIRVNSSFSIADAGANDTICGTTTLLTALPPTAGTGAWTLVSGTGVFSDSSLAQVTVTGLSPGVNRFAWTITNGICPAISDTVSILSQVSPGISNGGSDQTICTDVASLSGNTPSAGMGFWKRISGTGILADSLSASTSVSGLSVGVNQFTWTLSNGVCPASTDTVSIEVTPFPTVANVGLDVFHCDTVFSLSANSPTQGTGLWSVLTGGAVLSDPAAANSSLSPLSLGENKLVWSISFGSCPPSKDTLTITRLAPPTTANAGADQLLCLDSTLLNAVPLTVGMGVWRVLEGNGTLTDSTSASTPAKGLSIGLNRFVWVTSNGLCPVSTDTLAITVQASPGVADAGQDLTVCDSILLLNGNPPAAGSGLWTVSSGAATFSDPTQPDALVTSLAFGESKLVWTLTNGTCPPSRDTVRFVRVAPSNAGSDVSLCQNQIVLSGNIPFSGSGVWKVIQGTGVLADSTSANSLVSNLSIGLNILSWTFKGGSCPGSSDTLALLVNPSPTVSVAGPDQILCNDSTSLSANLPVSGTGVWSVISGSGTLTNASEAASSITGIGAGSTKLVWTISTGICPASTDTVTILRYLSPDLSQAGVDQTLCTNQTSLAGNQPTIGTGSWRFIGGSGTLVDSLSSTSQVTGLGTGLNRLVWTIRNGICPAQTDTVSITVQPAPSVADAGVDFLSCDTLVNLSAITPTSGNGQWSLVSGTAIIGNPNAANTPLTAIPGITRLVWTVSSGSCPISTDTLEITFLASPSAANAGPDQTLCQNQTTLAANVPGEGTGTWKVVQGSGILADSASPSSALTGIGTGVTILTWTVGNGVCPSRVDSVQILFNGAVVANAGPSLVTCGDTILLQGVAAVPPATGQWSLVSGSGLIANPAAPTTKISGLASGANIFQWSVSSPTCPQVTDSMVVFKVSDNLNLGKDTVICDTASLVIQLGNQYSFVAWQDGSTSTTYTIDTAGTYIVNVTAPGNCVFTDTIVVGETICTSVSPTLASNAVISVYPNPFSGEIHLEVGRFDGRELSYRLLTLNGVEILHGLAYGDKGQIQKAIQPGNLPGGMYLLEVKMGERIHRTKLVRQ